MTKRFESIINADEISRNGRVYPKEVLLKTMQDAVNNHIPVDEIPCEDCVSREAVLALAKEECETAIIPYKRFVKGVNALPPVIPKQRTGHWVEENINVWSRKVFCSECGCQPPFEHVNNGDVYSASGYGVSNKTKFCPNCGAKMEGEQ